MLINQHDLTKEINPMAPFVLGRAPPWAHHPPLQESSRSRESWRWTFPGGMCQAGSPVCLSAGSTLPLQPRQSGGFSNVTLVRGTQSKSQELLARKIIHVQREEEGICFQLAEKVPQEQQNWKQMLTAHPHPVNPFIGIYPPHFWAPFCELEVPLLWLQELPWAQPMWLLRVFWGSMEPAWNWPARARSDTQSMSKKGQEHGVISLFPQRRGLKAESGLFPSHRANLYHSGQAQSRSAELLPESLSWCLLQPTCSDKQQ